MANASKRIYTGMTNSLRRRVREHKQKQIPSFAAKYNITRLVYFESLEMLATRSSAKSKSRLGLGQSGLR